MQIDGCARRWAAILVCVLLSAAVPSHASAHSSLPVFSMQSRVTNATPIAPAPLREAARCIRMYQPCGRGPGPGPFQCCPGLQCLPLSDTGYLCGPPPNRR